VAAWFAAFKVIPWADVIAAAPTVARGAKELWATVRDQPSTAKAGAKSDSPEGRLHELESQLADLRKEVAASTELINSLAEHNARLVEAIGILRIRTRALLVATIVAFALLVVLGGAMLFA